MSRVSTCMGQALCYGPSCPVRAELSTGRVVRESNLHVLVHDRQAHRIYMLSLRSIITMRLKSMHCAISPDIPASAKTVAGRFGPMSLRPPDVSALCHLGPQMFRPITCQFGLFKQNSSFSCTVQQYKLFLTSFDTKTFLV